MSYSLRFTPVLLLALLLCTALTPPGRARTADARAIVTSFEAPLPVITLENVYEHPALWPTVGKLTDRWVTPSGKVLKSSYPGVVIRIRPDDTARIDFGRHGVHDIALARTDLIERANAIRRGEQIKMAPNFVLLMGTKLLDPSASAGTPLPSSEIYSGQRFLCIFADPAAPDFPGLVADLIALRGADGLRTIFFPQNLRNDAVEPLLAQLRELEWTVPVAAVASYTRSLLQPEQTPPYALVVDPEGLLLHEAPLGKRAARSELARALSAAPSS